MSGQELATLQDDRGPVFISYARSDGAALAEALELWFAQNGLDSWRDRTDMVFGDEWWRQIREQICGAESFVLVATKGAIASAVVRRELGIARAAGVPVLPVTTDPAIYKVAPRWLSRLNILRLRDGGPASWTPDTASRLLVQLQSPPIIAPIVHSAPPLPAGTVPRSGASAEVKAQLLDEVGDAKAGSATVIVGPGGYGKTTLALDICHDEEVIAAFSGGVAWASVGQGPAASARVCSELVSALTRSEVEFSSVAVGLDRLADELAHRDCLLVLDDVWDPGLLEALGRPGDWSLLVTTREPEVAAFATGDPVDLGLLEPGEALEVLLASAQLATKPEADSAELADLLDELGGWPLVLALAGASIRRQIAIGGMSGTEAMAWMLDGFRLRGPTFGDLRRSDSRSLSLERSLLLSLELFDDDEQQRVAELAALPIGGDAPVHALYRLWSATAGLDEFDSEALLGEIAGHFVQVIPASVGGGRAVRVHDLMAEYLGQRHERGLSWVHEQVLESMGERHQPWPLRATDHWDVTQLSHHLLGAGRAAELEDLLTRSPGWMNHSERCTHGLSGYVVDVERLIDNGIDGSELPLVRLLSLHAVRSVAHEKSRRFTDEALRVLVSLGRAGEALGRAQLRADAATRFTGILAVQQAEIETGSPTQDLLPLLFDAAAATGAQRTASIGLIEVAEQFAARGDWSGVEGVAAKVPLPWAADRCWLLAVEGWLAAGERAIAELAAEQIGGGRVRSEALAILASIEQNPDEAMLRYRGAIELLDGFPDGIATHAQRIGRIFGRTASPGVLAELFAGLASDELQGLAMVGVASGHLDARRLKQARAYLDRAERHMRWSAYDSSRDKVMSQSLPLIAELNGDDAVIAAIATMSYPDVSRSFFGAEAAEAERWDLAERLLAELSDEDDRRRVLLALTRSFAAAGERDRAGAMADELLAVTRSDRMLSDVSGALVPADIDRALGLALEIGEPTTGARAQLVVAEALGRQGASERAESLLNDALDHAAPPNERRPDMLGAVAALAAGNNSFAAAVSVADRVDSARESMSADPRTKAFERVARAAAGAGHLDDARSVADHVDPYDRSRVERSLLEGRARHGELAALQMEIAAIDDLHREFYLRSLLGHLTQRRGADEAIAFWNAHREPGYNDDWALMTVAVALARDEATADALQLAEPVLEKMNQQIADGRDQSTPALFGIADLAVELERTGDRSKAAQLAALAWRRLPHRLIDYGWLAESLAVTGQLSEVEETLASEYDILSVANLWIGVAERLRYLGRVDEANVLLDRAEPLAGRSARGEHVIGIGRMDSRLIGPMLRLVQARISLGHWSRALDTLGVQPAEIIVEQIAVALGATKLESITRLETMAEVLRIFGWLGGEFSEIHTDFASQISDAPKSRSEQPGDNRG